MKQAAPADQIKPLLRVLSGERVDPPPVWLMRQAGRYLPEYRRLRASAGGFLDLCFSPELASEVTLQPIRRFGFDAAILFADILLIPLALGQRVEFVAGEGPRLDAPADPATLADLGQQDLHVSLAPIYETVSRVRAELPPDVALIGFAGAPWTVASYMIAGGKDRTPALAWLRQYPDRYEALSDLLVTCTVQYLSRQIEAGAEAVQLFDSWAGDLPSGELAARFCIEPARRIVAGLRELHPRVPVIGYPRGLVKPDCLDYADKTGVTALSLDQTIDPGWAAGSFAPGFPLQGNLDPVHLEGEGAGLRAAVLRIREGLRGHPHIFNLGHGIRPSANPELVARLVSILRDPQIAEESSDP